MERKIGEIFEYNGEWYQCLKSSDCRECAFNKKDKSICPPCEELVREDGEEVIFKKLEKVGGPLKINGRAYQGLISPYRFNNCSMCAFRNISCKEVIPCYDDYVYIEIKQNKEDMKTVKISKDDLNFLVNKIRYGILPKHTTYDEITDEISNLFSVDDTKHSNSESIGKNLKPFSLEAAKSGKPVCTRDGRKARIICFDYKGDANAYPILALILTINLSGVPSEIIAKYTEDGRYAKYNNVENNEDLMMLPEEKEGWAVIRRSDIYENEERAKDALLHSHTAMMVRKITWSE